MRVEGSFRVAAPRERVFAEITNPALMAACIPGCDSIEVIDARSYRAAIVVEVGPIKARFNLIVEVTAEEPPARVLSVTRGEEGGRASMLSASNELVLEMTADGATDVKYVSDVAITGRLGKFGLGIMKKKSASLAERFEQAFRGHVEVAAAS